MTKQRVLLVCSQDLFGESVESVLRCAEDIELIGAWSLDDDIRSRIPEANPGVVVIADEDPTNENAVHLATAIMEQYPDLPVICTGLAQNIFRVFSTRTLPARSTDLLDAIHSLSTRASDPNEIDPGLPVISSAYLKRDNEQNQRSDS